MTAIKVSAFGGMIPAQDDRLLPQNNAALALNACLDSGALQGMHITTPLHTLVNTQAKRVFRIPMLSPDKNHMASSYWMEFNDPDTDILSSPVANDAFDRYYFTSPSVRPQYNTLARIEAGSAPFYLGITAPSVAPGVTSSGGVGVAEARAYVYTWVSAYGEEGPPSPATLHTGKVDDTWAITMTAPGAGDTTNRNLATTRIYRTISTAAGTAAFFFVAEVGLATLSYNDTISDTLASNNAILNSFTYTPPPVDLAGFVSMPNGMFAGFRGNEIWFCEPYKPWAWPASYTLSIDYDVVGLGVVGQTLMVMTDAYPYAISGISPGTMASSKIATQEPCLSRGSIVSTSAGVFYASPNGLVIAAYGVAQNATVSLVTKDKWNQLLNPLTLRGAKLNSSYYCWGGPQATGVFEPTAFYATAFEEEDYTGAYDGAFINLTDQRIAWAQLYNPTPVRNVITDVWNGEVFLIRNGIVEWLDFTTVNFDTPYLWRSKIFQTLDNKNLAVIRVMFKPQDDPTFVLNPVRDTSNPQVLKDDQYGIVRVYADNVLVSTREIRESGEIMRLPSGFKAQFWQFEIEARVFIYSVELGASARELRDV